MLPPTCAVKWWTRAAERDHVGSMWALGKAYRDGHGVLPDLALAKAWLKRGKELGDPACARTLAGLPPPHAPHGEAMGDGFSSGGFMEMMSSIQHYL